MKFQMEVQGLNGLRKASGLAPRQFDVVLRHAVKVSAIQMRHVMVEEVRKFAVDGRFPGSIRYRLRGLSATVGSMAATALSIERGRRVGEVVPVGRIRRWLVRKGLVRGIFSIGDRKLQRKTNYRANRYGGVVDAELAEAARIVQVIRQRGTVGKLYGARTVERSKDRVLRNFKESTQKALRGLAQIQRRAA